jgi:hypothetical protein
MGGMPITGPPGRAGSVAAPAWALAGITLALVAAAIVHQLGR